MTEVKANPINKRHCMVVHAHYPLGETRVEREAQALIDHGYEVDVICLGAPSEPVLATVDGVQIHRLSVRRHKGGSFMAQLFEYLAFFGMGLYPSHQIASTTAL